MWLALVRFRPLVFFDERQRALTELAWLKVLKPIAD